ncbi:MAG: hypothetical protein BGP13_09540 [Sphingobacteriales bacterium 40-81]|nr:MAG: hypothetical protein BGP13_09540 [Sphingobacteriales bacterium 40-81]
MEGFYKEASEDPAITISGICLYQYIFYLCSKSDGTNKVLINRRDVEKKTKIGRTTYQKTLKELQSLGYIKYTPSFNQFLGSMIEFYGFPETVLTIKVYNHEILFNSR